MITIKIIVPLPNTPSVQELSTNFRSFNELKLDIHRENLVHTSLESSLQELSSDTWFSTGVSESSGLNQPHRGSNDIEWPGDLLDPAKYFERAPSNTTHNPSMTTQNFNKTNDKRAHLQHP